MQRTTRHGNRPTLPELLAHAGIIKAMRPYRRAMQYAIGLIVPEWTFRHIYLNAALDVVGSGGDRRGQDSVRVFDEAFGEEDIEAMTDIVRHRRIIILFEPDAVIPPGLRDLLDIVVEIDRPDVRLTIGVVLRAYGTEITPAQAASLAACDWSRLALATARGRPIFRTLTLLSTWARPEHKPKPPASVLDGVALDRLEGFGAARTWGLELARDLKDWRMGLIPWDDVDRGALLSGPPGVGKTLFARALARSCDATLVSASYAKWQAKGSLDQFLKAMQRSFRDAKDSAPAILFLDEIDAFGSRDGAGGHNASYDVKAINGLLEQLDGIDGREGVVVVAASNRPELIDAAILRSGRLETHVAIGLPDVPARIAMLDLHLRDAVSVADCRSLAESCEGVSGADIQRAVRNARREARRRRRPIQADDVARHLPFALPVPPEVLRATAVHEAGHAIVGTATGMELSRIEILPRLFPGHAERTMGKTVFRQNIWARRTKSHHLDTISMTLAGMAAEEMILGEFDDGSSAGSGSDLEEATRLALAMEMTMGMGAHLISIGEFDMAARALCSGAEREVFARVDEVLHEQFVRAKEILTHHRAAVDRLVDTLSQTLVASGPDVFLAMNEGILDPGRSGCRVTPK